MMDSSDPTLQNSGLIASGSSTIAVSSTSPTIAVSSTSTTFAVTNSSTFTVSSPTTTFSDSSPSTGFAISNGVNFSNSAITTPNPISAFSFSNPVRNSAAQTVETGSPFSNSLNRITSTVLSPTSNAFSFSNSNTNTISNLNPTTTAFTFQNLTNALPLSNTSGTRFTFSNPVTNAFTFTSPSTSAFSFSNPATPVSSIWQPTFAFPNAKPNELQFGFKRTSGSKKYPPHCGDSSTQTEEGLCVNKLLQGLEEMLFSGKHSDFVLVVKGKKFRVHKIILAAHSAVFAAMMEHDTTEKATGTANIDDFEQITFQHLLHFLYTGKVENLNNDNVLDLYEVSDKYQVLELSNICIKYMMNNISIDNFCDILFLSLRHHVKELTEVATQFFLKHSKEIAITSKWTTFLTQNPVAGNELFLKALDMKRE